MFVTSKVETGGPQTNCPDVGLETTRLCPSFLLCVHLFVQIFYRKVRISADCIGEIFADFAVGKDVDFANSQSSSVEVAQKASGWAELWNRVAVVNVEHWATLSPSPVCRFGVFVVHWAVPSSGFQQRKCEPWHKRVFSIGCCHIFCTNDLSLPVGRKHRSVGIFQQKTCSVFATKVINNLLPYPGAIEVVAAIWSTVYRAATDVHIIQ